MATNNRVLRSVWQFCWVLLLSGNAVVAASELDVQRLDFLRAEQLLNNGDNDGFEKFLPELESYPLYSYLVAKWLTNHLDRSEQMTQFLERFPNNRYAEQLRAEWLKYLAGQGRWSELQRFYKSADPVELQCLFNQAQYLKGEKTAALSEAKKLWLSDTTLPPACDYLINAFKLSTEFSSQTVWKRFDLLLQAKKASQAERLLSLLGEDEQRTAKFWLQLHINSELINSPEFQNQPVDLKGMMFAHAVTRMAATSPAFASLAWDGKKDQFELPDTRRQQVEHDLALGLAKHKSFDAFPRLMKVSLVDEDIKDWRVRTALQEGNWSHVLEAIASFNAHDQALPKWQYWQSRALWMQGKQEQALVNFRILAAKRDYYGFLAADYAGLNYQLENRPVVVEPAVLSQLAESDPFKIVRELRYHNREQEAKAQWWFTIKQLDKAQIAVAAKLAQQWQWRPIDMFTIVKAEQWDDVDLRFPLLYQDSVTLNANLQELDPSLVFGLIRQESAFAPDAASSVGARGLMQIMPTTGMQIAKELKEAWASKESLFNPDTNIKYGAYYYSKLVRRFGGHFALAAAAYNAGPKRVDSWLPLEKSMPADVWIETIPFTETRKYVSSVLAYAIIYQQRMQRSTYKIRDFLQDVLPL